MSASRPSSPLAIWWIRRDLRLIDNAALSTALNQGFCVLPVFVLDPSLLAKPASHRKGFLFEGLHQLRRDLLERDSHLLVRKGDPEEVLGSVLAESRASRIFAEEDYSPYSQQRDQRVSRALPLERVVGTTIHHPSTLIKSNGEPYQVFTPFSRLWKSLHFPTHISAKAPASLGIDIKINGEPLPQGTVPEDFPSGETEANRRLESFLQNRIFDYAESRDRLDLPGTSMLSPYLRFGMISPRRVASEVYLAAQSAEDAKIRQSVDTYFNELIWREFYHSVLFHSPYVLKKAFQPALRDVPWRSAPGDLLAWQEGLTGVPVVDACMRQLRRTGWMHNRGRMIAASFLVKDLLIDWREGEQWFMCQLVDGDPAANNGGWQWTAGVGTDAAPYFRIFNPVSQAKRHDPEGNFVHHWVPELAHVPLQYVHEPWLMPEEIQRANRCIIGKDYPAPIIDHRQARERTLTAYHFSRNKGRI